MPAIFITGAASGIGRATAELFYKKGWTLGLADRDISGLKTLQKDMDKTRTCLLEMDVTDEDSVSAAFATFNDFNYKGLDVLFNCAGILRMGNNETIALTEQHLMMQINVGGILNCIHHALPALKRQANNKGRSSKTNQTKHSHIISMSSASAVYGTPELSVYSASKHAVRGLTEALNIELEPKGIWVSDIMVPYVKTPMVQAANMQAASIKKTGVNVNAATVANAVWQAAHSERIHRQVSVAMYLLSFFHWAMPFSRKWLLKRLASD